MSVLILIIWLALMTGFLYLAFLVIKAHQSAALSPRRRRTWGELRQVFGRLQSNKLHSKMTRIAYTSPGISGLWHQLLIRVQFNVATAERLVENLRRKYPGKNDRWYIEKAIWDLDRDRMI
ncbi:hypothetical protein [Cylindrospermum sp. FACHB-282]|uniref:hypothetical protein n=1 Tax=Cylindrospermum sp. FACHB-282 TaxID=2692794 RepID=UPI00168637E9|nr:hypothetical protein [Cylindrospermum sp. FACHB-282]MBD2388888.1 hypothetical protein [Cylindrospermum sp. FACHB-282]